MDRYTRIRKIGAGAFGEVMLARDNTNGEEVAIKHLYIRDESTRGASCFGVLYCFASMRQSANEQSGCKMSGVNWKS
jgi:serine/threonine protein kinase